MRPARQRYAGTTVHTYRLEQSCEERDGKLFRKVRFSHHPDIIAEAERGALVQPLDLLREKYKALGLTFPDPAIGTASLTNIISPST